LTYKAQILIALVQLNWKFLWISKKNCAMNR